MDRAVMVKNTTASQHASPCSWHPLLRRRSGRPNGKASRLARMASGPHHRYGGVVHSPAHGVLRGQRTTSSPLEVSAAGRLLGRAEPRRHSDPGPGAPEIYADAKGRRTGTTPGRTLITPPAASPATASAPMRCRSCSSASAPSRSRRTWPATRARRGSFCQRRPRSSGCVRTLDREEGSR
jgi:hypothetical protein